MLSLLEALPKLLTLVLAIIDAGKLAKARGDGRKDIVDLILQKAINDIQKSNKVEVDAEKSHKAHPNDDDGFDPHFRRD